MTPFCQNNKGGGNYVDRSVGQKQAEITERKEGLA